jgi:hypothetical protein
MRGTAELGQVVLLVLPVRGFGILRGLDGLFHGFLAYPQYPLPNSA